jgi:ATP-dependent DNA ligase
LKASSRTRDSKYNSGRSNDWPKKTCAQRETLTIAGFALDGSGAMLAARCRTAGHANSMRRLERRKPDGIHRDRNGH